jgi:hypothetical protein
VPVQGPALQLAVEVAGWARPEKRQGERGYM